MFWKFRLQRTFLSWDIAVQKIRIFEHLLWDVSHSWTFNISGKNRFFVLAKIFRTFSSLINLSVDKISVQNAITWCFGIYHIIGSISSKMPITLDSKSERIRSSGIFHNSMESVLWAKSELKRAWPPKYVPS